MKPDATVEGGNSGRWARVALFAVLWFIATFYFCGELGKWTDDWSLHVRGPATGRGRWDVLLWSNPFGPTYWRPLHYKAIGAIRTLLWDQDRIVTVFVVLLHGMNAWLLWRVLGRLCRSPRAAAVGALVFLVYPAGHEAVFWLSTLGTSAGTCCFLLCTLAAERFARGEIGRRGLLMHIPLLLTLAWWYEQPAACGPAVALAYLACAPSSVPARRRAIIAAGMAAVAVVGGAAYAGTLLATAPPLARGGVGRVVHPSELVERIGSILSQGGRTIALEQFGRGAIEAGWAAMRERWAETIALGVALLAAMVGFGRWWMRAEDDGNARDRNAAESDVPSAAGRAWAISFGLGVAAASMAPIIAVEGQRFESRLAYLPVLGLACVLSTGLDIPLSGGWAHSGRCGARVLRAGLLGALFVAIASCATQMVGVQWVRHKRLAADRRLGRELRELVPNPPPDAVFVPVDVRGWPVGTRSSSLNQLGTSPLELPWSAEMFIGFEYGRPDVHSLAFSRWLHVGRQIRVCNGAAETGLVVLESSFPQAPYPNDSHGRRVIPWDKIIAVRIDGDGHAELVGSMIVEDSQDPTRDRVVFLPAVARAAKPPSEGSGIIVSASLPENLGAQPAWRLVGPDGRTPDDRAAAAPTAAGGWEWNAYTMHPRVEAIPDRGELDAEVPGSDRARAVAMRVSMSDQALGQSDGVEVSVEVDGAGVVAREVVTPARLRREKRWIVVRATLAPDAKPRMVRVRIGPGPKSDPSRDWCVVTPPIVVDEKP